MISVTIILINHDILVQSRDELTRENRTLKSSSEKSTHMVELGLEI